MTHERSILLLKNNFPCLLIEYMHKPPHFISLLTSEEDIVFISKPKSDSTHISYSSSVISSSGETTNLTGQPLELEETLNEDVTVVADLEPGHSYFCVDLQTAKRVINFCNLRMNGEISVWVLCKENDGCGLRGTFRHKGWIEERWASSGSLLVRPEDLSAAHTQLLIKHQNLSRLKSVVVDKRFKCKMRLLRLQSREDAEGYQAEVDLSLEGSGDQPTPSLVSHSNINLTLSVGVCMGHGSPEAVAFWQQLVYLQECVELIRQGQESPLVPLPHSHKLRNLIGEVTEPVESRLQNLVSECGKRSVSVVPKEATVIELITYYSRLDRPCLDLLDRFWLILLNYGATIEDLSKCFNSLLSSLQGKNMMRLFLDNPQNISRLSEMLSEKGFYPVLKPLEFLIEIGIEKLKKEVMMIFSKLNFAWKEVNIPQLPKFSKLVEEGKWLESVSRWLHWLSLAHWSLMMLDAGQQALFLGHNELTVLSQPLLSKVMTSSQKGSFSSLSELVERPHRSLSLPLSIDLYKKKNLETRIFDEWMCQFKSVSPERVFTSIQVRSLNRLLPSDQNSGELCGSARFDSTLMNDTVKDIGFTDKYHTINYHCLAHKIPLFAIPPV